MTLGKVYYEHADITQKTTIKNRNTTSHPNGKLTKSFQSANQM